MLKTYVRSGVLALSVLIASAATAAVGPHAGDCSGSGKNAMLVKVVGLKNREGFVRIQSYGGDPDSYFEKGAYLSRVDMPPSARTIEVCVPVPKPGTYAISVRHSLGGTFSMTDGVGFSGNPNMSLMDAMFKRKPPAGEVQVKVNGVARVSVTMNYVKDGQLRPIAVSSVPSAE